jgi:hypothetical protein
MNEFYRSDSPTFKQFAKGSAQVQLAGLSTAREAVIWAFQGADNMVSAMLADKQEHFNKKNHKDISHDSRDADLAEEFGNLLSDVSGGTLKSFRSSDHKGTAGIEFGAEWYQAIMTKLGDATDVVALLTQSSINRPWILYEAGVAKGKLDTIVFGLAIGVPLEKVSTGPFGQFQNCSDEETSYLN